MYTENVFGGLDHVAHYDALRLARAGHGFVLVIPAMTFWLSVWISAVQQNSSS